MANCGLNGVRIEHVAARAVCNKALVYRYFHDRETLFVEAFRHQLAQRLSILGELPEALAAMLQHWTEQTLNDRAFVRLIMREAMDYDGGAPVESSARSSYCATQISMMRELQEQDVVDGQFDAEMLFLALLSLIMLPAMLPQIVFLASGLESSSPEFSRRWSLFFEHLSKHLRPGASGRQGPNHELIR